MESVEVFLFQKTALYRCNMAGKPAVVTRVVDSMTNNLRPTRAVATVVANAVLDGSDAILLGAETSWITSSRNRFNHLVGAVEDLGQSSLEHILDNFDVDNRNCLSSWTIFSCFTEGKAERKELQKQFQAALKEHKMMELMLDELEMIHEEATNKIALLESEDCSLKTDQKHGVVE
ncbi:pyruvate kinase 1, cytosolic-like isoform X2 [Cucumis melo var. makuwa]|uniref:Pyruvate kinase n=3 Tax=Cucumis melo TaxID=3656 RepID=A0A5A7T5Z6_CUCMM|nr:pyruvate kinase 1, cytosolic-like isoform X2 [Cucumis melo var. makuwa]